MVKEDASSFIVRDYSAVEITKVTAPITSAMIRWYPVLYVGMAEEEEPDKPPAADTLPLRKFGRHLDWMAL